MTLQLLISKLSEAGGGSRELDAEICAALHYPPLTDNDAGIGITMEADSDGALRYYAGKRITHKGHAPRVTESLDAALSLVEQKLPGWEWLVRSSPSYACVWQAKGVGDLSAEATLARPATPTLALLVALLRALDAPPPSPQGPR